MGFYAVGASDEGRSNAMFDKVRFDESSERRLALAGMVAKAMSLPKTSFNVTVIADSARTSKRGGRYGGSQVLPASGR